MFYIVLGALFTVLCVHLEYLPPVTVTIKRVSLVFLLSLRLFATTCDLAGNQSLIKCVSIICLAEVI